MPAGVAVGDFGQELERVVVDRRVVLAEAAVVVGQCPANQRLDVVDRQRLELEHAAAAHQRVVHGEKWVGRREPDQDHDALFDVGQQRILLGLVEAVDLVDHQQRRPPAGGDFVAGLFEHFADVFHAAGDRAELPKAAVRLLGQQPRERRLAGARRAVEDHRPEPLGPQHSPQQLAFAEEVLLADKFRQRSRPHPRRERLHLLEVGCFGLGEKIGHW